MAFKMTPNGIPSYIEKGKYTVETACPLPKAQAMRDPRIRFFFICRAAFTFNNHKFQAGEAVFLTTTPWAMINNKSSDVYEKDFSNVAYLDLHIPLRHVGCSRLDGDPRPFFDIACLAANMHGAADHRSAWYPETAA
jgi:hypothetical protein